MVICLERGAELHMSQLMPLPLAVSCFSKIQIGFTFLVPAHPGSPGQRAVKRVCVCVCVCVFISCCMCGLHYAGVAKSPSRRSWVRHCHICTPIHHTWPSRFRRYQRTRDSCRMNRLLSAVSSRWSVHRPQPCSDAPATPLNSTYAYSCHHIRYDTRCHFNVRSKPS